MSLRRLTWTAYLLLGCEGYLIYSVGYITPYLQSELGAPPWAAALPSSALAIGLIISGFIVNRVVRALGSQVAIRLWILLMAVSTVLMSLAVSIWPILAGTLLLGIAISGVLVYVITSLAERDNGVYLMRAVLWSVVGGVLGPIALSAAARTIGWNFGAVLIVPVLLVLAFLMPPSAAPVVTTAERRREPPLGRAYWLAWIYLLLGVAAEFSFVTWGTQVTVAQAGLALTDATALASLFVFGEVIGRLALSGGPGARIGLRVVLGAGTVLGAVGGVMLWVAGFAVMAGAGMFLAGLGISVIYPLATRLAVAHTPHAPVKASARLTAASGVAIFAAPLLLGVVAGIAGVISAWALLIAILVAALVVLWLIPIAPVRDQEPVAGAGAVPAVASGGD
ncbi:MAG TPA: hypothetical protein VES19_06585 [Candidatus Limnocylindrales bacterium]|nr:hypothetical protein [Candidatus Limnocylindrales bacterium]